MDCENCEGVCCVAGTTPTPVTTDPCVCNAAVGAHFVGTTGLIYIRTAATVPCSASDWVLLSTTGQIYAAVQSNDESSLIAQFATYGVTFPNPVINFSSGMTSVTGGWRVNTAGVYRVHAAVYVVFPGAVDETRHMVTSIAINGVIVGMPGFDMALNRASHAQTTWSHGLYQLAVNDVIGVRFAHAYPDGLTISKRSLNVEMV